ncbi:hypothetical protein Tco_0403714 [Tanacetum coccineum]
MALAFLPFLGSKNYTTSISYDIMEVTDTFRISNTKATKSKDRVLKNKTDKRPSAHVRKSVLSTKTVNAVNEGSNTVCVSCGKDVFLLSHEKCVARYALSRNYSVKRALFTTLITTKSNNLGATSVVAQSRLSVAKTTTTTNKVIQLVLWIVDSGCSKHMTGRNFIEKFMGTVRFGNDHFAAITGYGDYVQDLEVAFHLNTCYVQNLKGDDFLTGSRDSNLYTISVFEMVASSPVC